MRFKPDIKSMFIAKKMFYSDEILDLANVKQWILQELWTYDFAGCISRKTFTYIIDHEYIVPQGTKLNGETMMDASNFYCQAADMATYEMLIKKLKEYQ
ncbi:hypothetical protein C4F49_16400 [Sphingobacterium sp. KB22]|uniref:Uncharacterized protein n=2 Tax=Sphingobacterium hungaricum TaxID=2082723 RepID=A0A928V2E2_9SPHI|nr:hypothetical protein [Sphingobacterium hungaricum]